ncbi:hypothetical protein [Undibacterium sp. Ji49W]|uniref:hypothetical protein n=1 Tax=Undibacterium sp. Ji49W TaxID=3413040 RepID=UPI003BF400E3
MLKSARATAEVMGKSRHVCLGRDGLLRIFLSPDNCFLLVLLGISGVAIENHCCIIKLADVEFAQRIPVWFIQ